MISTKKSFFKKAISYHPSFEQKMKIEMTVKKGASTKRPNFLIVGAARSGTTSLYNYLKQHPDIYMPKHKEPLFMTSEIYANLSERDPRRHLNDDAKVYTYEDYLCLFADAMNEKMLGEASATYLYYYESAIPKIKYYLDDPKIIIMLRDPVARAYSSYGNIVRDGAESCSFDEFLEQEETRKRENWDILNMPVSNGLYFAQVKAYLDNFTDVRVIIFDDFKKDTFTVTRETYAFLGVDSQFTPDVHEAFNQSVRSKYKLIEYLLNKDNPLKRAVRPMLQRLVSRRTTEKIGRRLREGTSDQMNPNTKAFLKQVFHDDILRLQDLLSRDLSAWL